MGKCHGSAEKVCQPENEVNSPTHRAKGCDPLDLLFILDDLAPRRPVHIVDVPAARHPISLISSLHHSSRLAQPATHSRLSGCVVGVPLRGARSPVRCILSFSPRAGLVVGRGVAPMPPGCA